ncbi:MAG: type II secretion system F family protein [Nitrososphaeria archaeon]|jgi:flagellar protein FlaJ
MKKGKVSTVKKEKVGLTFAGLSYTYFGWFGRGMFPYFQGIAKTLESANVRIHPETYLAMSGLTFFISLPIFTVTAVVGFFLISPLLLSLIAVPFIILVIFLFYPRFAATDRASNLDTEVPFAAAYVSVLASGGISPFKAFEKLKDVDFLPQLSMAAKIVYIDTRARGIDPVTALEESAKHVPSNDYKEFVLGYASTLRVGGDTEHYLLRRTEMMFENRKAKMKVIGERMALLMETYITVAILLALTLYVMYIVTKIMPIGSATLFSAGSFVMFAYIMLPVVSIVFLYLIDVSAPKYPVSDYRAYKWFGATIPFTLLLAYPMVIAFFADVPLGPLKIFNDLIVGINKALGLDAGFEGGVGICITLMVLFLPGMIADTYYSRQTRAAGSGITNFLRDLVEIRKTGISPEKCMFYLSSRNYGSFSKILKVMSNQINWGISFRKVMSNLREQLHGWLNMMSMFLLIDSIDVGGGTPETLESLASFSESINAIEREKKQNIKPLLLLPYLGGVILLVCTITIIFFARSVFTMYSESFNFSDFVRLFVPPIIFNTVFMGLIAGKVSGERVSAGFLHSFVLASIALLTLYIAPILMGSFQIAPASSIIMRLFQMIGLH